MPTAQKFTMIDISDTGSAVVDKFRAAHATAAVRRAQFAAEGVILQRWTNGQLVGNWRRVGPKLFQLS